MTSGIYSACKFSAPGNIYSQREPYEEFNHAASYFEKRVREKRMRKREPSNEEAQKATAADLRYQAYKIVMDGREEEAAAQNKNYKLGQLLHNCFGNKNGR